MDYSYEVTIVPVSDVDRAKEFYGDRLGWNVDVDHRAGEDFRVVQLTPPGSACSISIGTGISSADPGSYKGMHLVVSDIEAAREDLVQRRVEVGDFFHFGAEGQTPGLHPKRADYGTFLSFADPDGNGWLIQEMRERAPGR